MKRHPNTSSEVFDAALEPPHHIGLWFSTAEKSKPRSPRVSRGGSSRENGGGRSDRAGLLPRPQRPGIPIPPTHLRLSPAPMTQTKLCFLDPKGRTNLQDSEAMAQNMHAASDRKRSDWLGYAFMGAMFACTFLV